jgi:hypothetical protein
MTVYALGNCLLTHSRDPLYSEAHCGISLVDLGNRDINPFVRSPYRALAGAHPRQSFSHAPV